jgi:hypothetical protein
MDKGAEGQMGREGIEEGQMDRGKGNITLDRGREGQRRDTGIEEGQMDGGTEKGQRRDRGAEGPRDRGAK